MPRYVVRDKREGETPLQALERVRAELRIQPDVPMTYAGRLDPMASGKLLILIGEECRHRHMYDGLDKEYEFEILFGFTTDTGDILGLSERCADPQPVLLANVRDAAKALEGERTMSYPAYSSKTVNGKPLYSYALEGTLHEIQIPMMDIKIYSLRASDIREVQGVELIGATERRLAGLRVDEESTNPYKDFRRGPVLTRWSELIEPGAHYPIARVCAVVSAGTYIRALAPLIAEHVGACGLAYSIHRSRIGRYLPVGRYGLWLRSY